MSDKVAIIGIGGAGINITKSINIPHATLLDSSTISSPDKALEKLDVGSKEEVIIITSPAGEFSSSVLPSVCNALATKGKKIFLIAIMPFNSESEERKIRAENTLRGVKRMVASCDVVENENFASAMLEKSWKEAMDRIDSYVQTLIFKLVPEAAMITGGYATGSKGVLGFNPSVSS
ncbi:MAG: hypothetical protein QXN66_03765 [Thermoplasmatales archaeon]